MNKNSNSLWLFLVLLILLPTTFGRLIIDIAGGLLIFLILTPILIGGAGWIGWKIIQSKMNTCSNCGASFLKSSMQCPLCGLNVSSDKENTEKAHDVPASSATIDITPKS